jgi:hypothetical protein
MLNYRTVKVQNLKLKDLVELNGDKFVKHSRNEEVCTPAVLDKLVHQYGEVHKVDRAFESVTVLFQFGEIVFPEDHEVSVLNEC